MPLFDGAHRLDQVGRRMLRLMGDIGTSQAVWRVASGGIVASDRLKGDGDGWVERQPLRKFNDSPGIKGQIKRDRSAHGSINGLCFGSFWGLAVDAAPSTRGGDRRLSVFVARTRLGTTAIPAEPHSWRGLL